MNKFVSKAIATSFDEKEHTLSCVMTAEVIDRHGDIVDVESMGIDNFLLNPVVLQSHDYDNLPVGKVLSVTKTINEAGVKVLECVIKFAIEEYPVAKTHWELYKGGYMSAFSIGFRVGSVQTDVATNSTRLMDCELLEISCVSVPANQLALAKSKGVDIEPVLSSIPVKELQKAIRDTLIELKSILLVKETPEATQVTPSIELSKQRAKSLLEKAIRALR